jgi:hypothetical protein
VLHIKICITWVLQREHHDRQTLPRPLHDVCMTSVTSSMTCTFPLGQGRSLHVIHQELWGSTLCQS